MKMEMRERASAGGWIVIHRRQLTLGLLVALVPLLLGCFTMTATYKLTHNWKAGDVQNVTVMGAMEMDPVWSAEAKKANEAIVAQCKAENVPYTDTMHIPETFTDLGKQSGGMMDLDTDEPGTVTTQTANGTLTTKTMTLDEYNKSTEGEDDQMKLEIQRDTAADTTRYIGELTLPGLSTDESAPPFDWAKWDEFMKSKPGQKPKCTLPIAAVGEGTPTPEPQPTSALSGLLFSAGESPSSSSSSSTPLVDWYVAGIFRKTGYPTWIKYVIDLPGQVEVHKMNGQPEGVVQPDGSVLFAMDEAFLRKYTFKGPWVFHVETLVTAKMQRAGNDESRRTAKAQPTTAPKATDAPSRAEARATTTAAAAAASGKVATSAPGATSAAATRGDQAVAGAEGDPNARGTPSTTGMARFRIRQINSYSLGLPVGVAYATYELQELGADGSPERLARLRYMGAGPATSLRIMPRFLQKRLGGRSTVAAWTEFEATAGGAASRLEDFDGVKGRQTNTGTFWKSWTGAVFGTQESADEGTTSVYLTGTQLGLYAGVDATTGTWKIVGEIQSP